MLSFNSPLKILLKGSFLSQALALLLTPLVTWIYSPAEYGEYAKTINWALIISPVFALGLERAIPFVKKGQQLPLFIRLTGLSIKFLIAMIIGVWVLHCLPFYNVEAVKCTFILVIAFLVFYSILLGYLLVSNKQYKSDSQLKVTQTMSVLIGQICVGFYKPLFISLILMELLGRLSAVLYSALKNIKLISFRPFVGLKKLKQYYTFGLLSTILVTLCINLPVIIVATIYDEEMSALYFLAIKLLLAPAALISVSIGRLYYVECCDNVASSKSNQALFKSNLIKLFLAGLVIYSLVGIVTPFLVLLFEDAWAKIEQLMYILLPLAFVQFFSAPLSMTMTAYSKQYYDLAINFMRLLLVLALSYSAFYYKIDFYNYLKLYVAVSIMSYLVPLFISFKIVVKK